MSEDASLDFLIRTLADTHGIEAVRAALGRLKESSISAAQSASDSLDPAFAQAAESGKELAGAGEKINLTHREMGRALHLLGPEFGEAGRMAMMGMINPVMIGIVALVGALKLFDKVLKSLSPEEDTAGIKSLSSNLDGLKDAATAAQAAMIDYFAHLSDGAPAAEKLASATESLVEVLKLQAEIEKQAVDAQKDLELAKLKQAKAAGAVTDEEYEQRKVQIENDADARKVALDKENRDKVTHEHWEQVQKLEAEAKKQRASVPGLAEESQKAEAALKRNEELIKKARDNDAAWEGERKKKGILTPQQWSERLQNQGILGQAEEQQAGLQADAKIKADALATAEAGAKAAQKQADDLAAKTSTETAEASLKNRADAANLTTKAETRKAEADAAATEKTLKSPTAQALRGAAGAEDILQHGGKVSAAQASQLAAMKQLLQLTMGGGQANLEALGHLNSNQAALNAKIAALARKIEEHGRKIDGTFNP